VDEPRPKNRSRGLNEWDLPEPRASAEWAADKTFNAADEMSCDATLLDVFKSALDNGSVVVVQKKPTRFARGNLSMHHASSAKRYRKQAAKFRAKARRGNEETGVYYEEIARTYDATPL